MKKLYSESKLYLKILVVVITVLFSTYNNGYSQTLIFSQDFNTGADAIPANVYGGVTNAAFVSATPNSNQFTSIIGGRQSSSLLDINTTTSGELWVNSDGTSMLWALTRSVDMEAASPGAVKITMRVKIDITSTGSNPKFFMAVGSGMLDDPNTAAAIKPANATVHSGFGIRYASSSAGGLLWDYGSTAQASATSLPEATYMTITFVANNSGASINYTAPDASTEALADDTWEVWIDNTRYVNDQPATTPGLTSINQFKFGDFNTNGRADWNIDYVTVHNLASSGPSLSVTPTSLSGFTYEAGSGPSSSQTFTVSGSNLTTADVVVTAPSNYQVSLDGVTYSNSVNIVQGGGTLSATTVYTRLIAGLAQNTYSGNISTSGGGVATGPVVALSGDVTAPAVPTITTSNAAKTFVACPSGTDTETILVQGTLLTADVSLTLAGAGAARYSLSAASVPFATANGAGQSVVITYTGTAAPAGPHAATLTLASAGATSVVINLSGTTSTCYTLTSNVSPLGGGIVSASPSMASYPSGTVVTLVANANSGYTFDGWTGDASGTATTTITMDANKTVTANFIEALPTPPTINCLTEDLNTVADESSCVNTDDNYLCDGSTQATANLVVPSGTWALTKVRGEFSSYHSASAALRIDENGTVTTPTLDNPQTITFWTRPRSAYSGSLADGLLFEFNGVPITTGVTINGAPATADGFGRFTFTSTTYAEVTVPINSNTQGAFRITTGVSSNDRARYYFDDFSVACAGMNLEANPDQTGLDYVLAAGPSSMKPVVITGEDLSVSSGTVTLSNLGNFEISFDNGTTWQTGAGVTFPFTSNNFVKLAYVRLKSGLALGDYSQTITFSTPSYTKTSPSLYLAGSVIDVVTSPDCDDNATISKLIGKSNTVSDLSTLLIDDITGNSWVGNARVSVTQKSGVNYVRLQNESSGVKGVLTSPTLNFGEFQADVFSLQVASTSTNAVPVDIKYSVDNGAHWVLMQTVTTSNVSNYFTTFNIDLTPFPIGSSVKFQVTPNTNNEIIISNFITTAKAKRSLTSSVPLLQNFESHVNCPSAVQNFKITGTCMDDDGTLNFASTYYEFSTSPTGPFGNSIPYVGSFPSSGITVYVRQKGAASADASIVEAVAVSGGGVSAGLALEVYMIGEITAPSISFPEPNQVFNYVTPAGVSSRKVIDIESLALCEDFTVSTSGCGTITSSGCEAGPYIAGTTISKDFDNKKLYLQYTPGTVTNCQITLTSGVLTRTFSVNWSGYAAGAEVLIAEKSTMTANFIGVANPVMATASVDPNATVTISSSAGVSGFEFSLEDPAYGVFVPITSTIAANLGNLFIRKKATTASGTTETITLSAAGVTSAVFTVTAE